MPDLDGGGDCPPLYRGSRFPSQILRLHPLQIGRGHDRHRLGMLADKRERMKMTRGETKRKKKDLKVRRKENGQ